ncbi:hypothetical protein CYMTET_10915 [Cymbomonas tetramitiformis]|uniref:CCHC-type domain-containing protein n=1 Tax=Cymbomonas tetramitiformis TaxID=36881 RepID=A0AAE0LDP1_9CHLO|nr:hypothetical protein CYMTET_10915 [Cymbomonas tetramitiformis]
MPHDSGHLLPEADREIEQRELEIAAQEIRDSELHEKNWFQNGFEFVGIAKPGEDLFYAYGEQGEDDESAQGSAESESETDSESSQRDSGEASAATASGDSETESDGEGSPVSDAATPSANGRGGAAAEQSPPVNIQNAAGADQAYRAGTAAAARGDHAEALRQFRKAKALCPAEKKSALDKIERVIGLAREKLRRQSAPQLSIESQLPSVDPPLQNARAENRSRKLHFGEPGSTPSIEAISPPPTPQVAEHRSAAAEMPLAERPPPRRADAEARLLASATEEPRPPPDQHDAEAADEAYRTALQLISMGKTEAAVRSLKIALVKCPPHMNKAISKIQKQDRCRSRLAMAGGGKKKRFFPSTNKKNPADPEKKAANKEKYGKKKEGNSSNRAGSWKSVVCLGCRQTGHMLRFCPQNAQGEGKKTERGKKVLICFKCGEKGHSVWNCTSDAPADGSFAHATCFICGEKGHLSRDCSKNEHGLYVNGGCCKICKGTDHLAKDCPSKPVWNDWGSKTPQKANPKAATTAEGAHKKLAGGDDLEDDFADNVEDFAEEGDVNAADTEDADKQQSDKKRKKSDAPPASTAKKAKKVAKVVKF